MNVHQLLKMVGLVTRNTRWFHSGVLSDVIFLETSQFHNDAKWRIQNNTRTHHQSSGDEIANVNFFTITSYM